MDKAILELDKMPNACYGDGCPFYKITGICDILSSRNNYMPVFVPSEGRHKDCPLKLVEEKETERLREMLHFRQGELIDCPIQDRLAEAERLLEKTRQGYINLIDVKALPHGKWDEVARGIAEEIYAFLQEKSERGGS